MSVYTSYSRIGEHRACPQAWAFRALDHLERDDTSVPVELDYGTWWHAVRAADAIERGRSRGSLVSMPAYLNTPDGDLPVADLKSADDVIDAALDWWKRTSAEVRAAWQERLGITHLPGHLSDRFADWYSRWDDEISQEYPLAVELRGEREIPGTDLVLTYVIDEVYLDSRLGMTVIRDNKTGKSLDKGSTALGDMMDGQLHLYAWASAPQLAELGITAARAVAYDRARSSAGKSPVLTNAGKLSASVKDYSLWDYLRWLEAGPHAFPGTKKDGSNGGVYPTKPDSAVVERLSDPYELLAWFQRSLDPLNVNVIAAHVQEAVHTAVDIDRTRTAHAQGRGPGRNLGRSCTWCPYAKLCRAQMIGGRGGEYDLAAMGLRVKQERKGV